MLELNTIQNIKPIQPDMDCICFGLNKDNILDRDYLKIIVKKFFIKENYSKLAIAFEYDNDSREIFEIPEIITFCNRLVKTYPYCFLYFNAYTIRNIFFVLNKGQFEYPNKIIVDFSRKFLNMSNLSNSELELISTTIINVGKDEVF